MMKIYKLTNEDGLIYIGKTNSKYLSSRLSVHKSQAKTKRNINKCSSVELFKNNKKVKIELLEETDDKLKELYYINLYECVNKMKTGLTYKETKKNWVNKNPDYYNEYQKRTEVKEKRKEKVKCICGDIICKYSISNHLKSKIHKKNIILNKWDILINKFSIKNMDLN